MTSDKSLKIEQAKDRVTKYISHIDTDPGIYANLIEEAAQRLIVETSGVTSEIAASWMFTLAHLIRESMKD